MSSAQGFEIQISVAPRGEFREDGSRQQQVHCPQMPMREHGSCMHHWTNKGRSSIQVQATAGTLPAPLC